MSQESSFFDLGDEEPKSRPPAKEGVPLSTPARPTSRTPNSQQYQTPSGRPAPRKPAPTQQRTPVPPPSPAPLPQRTTPPLPTSSRLPTHEDTGSLPIPSTPSLPVQAPAPVPAPAPAPSPEYYSAPSPISPPPTQQQYSQRTSYSPHEEDDEDEDDFIEEYPQKPKKKKAAPKRERPAKRKKKKNKVDKGGKSKASLIRGIALTLIAILCATGIYNILRPPQFPSQQQVLESVQQGMGVTDFPADRAHGFVISFTEAYLTIDQEEGSSGRQADLNNYVPERILSEMSTRTGQENQFVVSGPFIAGTRYISDEDAVFTVSSQINTGSWIYLDVPVYYNESTRAFAISGAPAIVSAPRLSDVPRSERDWQPDDELAEEVREDLERFFEIWAEAEDSKEIERVSPHGDARVLAGIDGVTFNSLSDLEVSPPFDPEDPQSLHNVFVTVNWDMNTANGPPSEEDSPIQYSMSYELLVFENADQTGWYVQDIRGGVRSIAGSGPVDSEPEEE